MSTDIDDALTRLRRPLLYVMGVFYAAAGVMHFVAPKVYARIVPPQFPKSVALVYLSGIAEIGLGVGVLLRRTRQQSAWGLIALLIAVFPANVHMATSDVATDTAPDWAEDTTRAATWARLPLQGVLVLWAWWYTRLMPQSPEKDASNPEAHQ